MVRDFFGPLEVWRNSNLDPGNSLSPTASQFTKNGDIEGFIQVRSGSYPQANQSNMPTSSHILYADIGIDIVEGDRVKDGLVYYEVAFIQNIDGISGMENHQEISINFMKPIGS